MITEVQVIEFIDLDEIVTDVPFDKSGYIEDLWEYLRSGVSSRGDQDQFGIVQIGQDYILDRKHPPQIRWILTYVWNRYKHLFKDGVVKVCLGED